MADLDLIKDTPPTTSDAVARQEEKSIIADSKRKNRVSNVKNACLISILVFSFICVGILGLVLVIHLILPTNKYWLTPQQLADLKAFLVHGTFGGLIVGVFKSIIDGDK